MNNKLKKIIIIIFTFIFAIFLLNTFNTRFKKDKSDISNINILKYIPNNYQFTIISKSTNSDIKKYIQENISENKREELNIIKDSIISYLGFDLQDKIEDIYDNELALIFVKNNLKNNDILLIFKLKKNKDINNIINIGEDINKSNQIIELKRLGKLNYISHILQTKDNYIIASSNKRLIYSSLQSNNNINNNLFRNSIPDSINLKEIKLLAILKDFYPKNNSNLESQSINELITILNLESNKIKLRSFSTNLNKINNKIINIQIDNIQDIIFTDKHSKYKQSISFLYKDINQKDLLDEISQKVNDELLFITKNNNWVYYVRNESPHKVSIDELNFLKNYNKGDLYINNLNYSIYTNDKLILENNNISYSRNDPIFSLNDGVNIYISNNLNDLLSVTNEPDIANQYIKKNNEIESYKYILNDIYFIKFINSKDLAKKYKPLSNLQSFLNTKLFSLENINIHIQHVIPERYEKLYIESDLEIL